MKNIDKEMKINQEIKPEPELIDPMVFDTEEDRESKKEKWMEIFYRCPELSDHLLDLWANLGENGMEHLAEFLTNGFAEYYNAATKTEPYGGQCYGNTKINRSTKVRELVLGCLSSGTIIDASLLNDQEREEAKSLFHIRLLCSLEGDDLTEHLDSMEEEELKEIKDQLQLEMNNDINVPKLAYSKEMAETLFNLIECHIMTKKSKSE